jgi:hypothetical protein
MATDQYTVVTSDDLGTFEDRVNQLLEEGWTLQGGVAASALGQAGGGCLHVLWSQAMVLSSRRVEEEVTLEEHALPGPEQAADDMVRLPPVAEAEKVVVSDAGTRR